ncbi:MAG: hypothetical protein JO326_08415, partial [Acetobacteraceae bacterium]|nr:hypothetical protein [Acetobacteraceae bacterium]
RDWLANRGHVGAGEDEQAIAHVRRFIIANGSSRFVEPGYDTAVRDRVGWRKPDRNGGTDYLFQKDIWLTEVFRNTPIDPQRALEALDRAGFLNTNEGRLTAKVRIDGLGQNNPRVVWVKGAILSG